MTTQIAFFRYFFSKKTRTLMPLSEWPKTHGFDEWCKTVF